MVNKIEQDHQRFRQIVRGKIRRDLRRFIAKGELIGKEGQRFVSIPIHDIDIPTFRYGDNSGALSKTCVGGGSNDEAGVDGAVDARSCPSDFVQVANATATRARA